MSPCQFHDLTGNGLGGSTVGLHPLVGQKVEGLSFLEQRTHSLQRVHAGQEGADLAFLAPLGSG